MKSFAILAALVGSASAFSPAQVSRTSTSVNAMSDMVGGEGPEPMPFSPGQTSVMFDPAGFAELTPIHCTALHCTYITLKQQRSPEWLPWYREAELKHGRAAMLATVGFTLPEIVRIPGEQFSFEAIPKVINAHDALPGSMILILGSISLLEACTFPAMAGLGNGYDRAPGDFSFDPLGLFPTDPEMQKVRQLQELKNGRLAMIAIGGMVAGSAITGNGFPFLA
eukprot:scaffold1972_cov265-Chaetoceros_neogracile.AAC.52